jgi:transposase
VKKYKVTLTDSERDELNQLIKKGKAAARKLAHARILIKADEADGQQGWIDTAISDALGVSVSTIERVREQFVEEGLMAALEAKAPRRVYRRKLNGEQEAYLVTLVCSQPPADSRRWTLQLLADKMVELNYVDEVSRETVRQTLKKMNLSPG